MKRILFDSDVLLDVLTQREPFFILSAQALNVATRSDVQGYVAGHSVTNIFYILRRQIGGEQAREKLSILLQKLKVASVTDAVIQAALKSSISDFEDAVVSEAAKAVNVEFIITRNVEDFVLSSIPALLPQVFLAALENNK